MINVQMRRGKFGNIDTDKQGECPEDRQRLE